VRLFDINSKTSFLGSLSPPPLSCSIVHNLTLDQRACCILLRPGPPHHHLMVGLAAPGPRPAPARPHRPRLPTTPAGRADATRAAAIMRALLVVVAVPRL
jgi:hypothetical protein